MKIFVYENSVGFSSYTYKLCNAFTRITPKPDVSYMTEKNFNYKDCVGKSIKLIPVLSAYNEEKKNSIRWIWNRVAISLKNIKMRNAYLKSHPQDVISIQSTIPIIDQYFITRAKKYGKLAYTVHDVVPPIKSFYWNRHSLKKMYKAADILIVHSKANKLQLVQEFKINEEKIQVIHHGTEVDNKERNIAKCKKEIGIPDNKKSVLFYGLIREQKGLDLLISALKDTEYILVIAGKMPYGEDFDVYDKLLEKNRVSNIKFINYISEDFTETLFAGCDIIALPYKYFYSQSGVFMQAMQYGKPVVATDVSSFREYIDKYNFGLICAPDVPSLHKAIIDCFSDNDKLVKYSENARIAANDNTWDKSALIHIKAFEKSE